MAKKKPALKERLTSRRAVRIFWCVVAAPFALLMFMLGLTAAGAFGRLPSFAELENPQSDLATEIISEEGRMLGSFFTKSRIYVSYDEISPHIVAALVSTEDVRYYSHSGIDFISLGRVAFRSVVLRTLGLDQNQGGGSTITQQLAKNLFERRGWIVTDKLKEWVTAVKLEYNYTKDEIITMYLNTVLYGNNAYGIRTAAYTYFGKTPAELDVQEAATLVGMVNAVTRYNPIRNYDNSLARRNTVMRRMERIDYLTDAQYDSLSRLPIVLDYHPVDNNEGTGSYFRGMLARTMTATKPERGDYRNDHDYQWDLRRWNTDPLYGWIHKNQKADGTPYNIYSDGLKIYTTVNYTMQRYAEEAVATRLKNDIQPFMDRQYRRTGVVFKDQSSKQIDAIVAGAMRYSDRYREMDAAGASREQIEAAFDTPVAMKLYTYNGIRDTVITPRDSVIHFKKLMRASLVAIEPGTGHLKAYVGGPNYRYFKYDHATQGKRQPGSTIKPFVYTFAFSQLGLNPCTPVEDLPVTIESAGGVPWTPKEAGSDYDYPGTVHPLKWGLARSRNNYTAWIMKQAKAPGAVAEFIHNMGIHSWIDPVHALALGTMDVSLYELVGAFSTFANKGMNIEPVFVTRIEDRQGNLISSFLPEMTEAINEQTAYTTLQVLQEVVNNGTGSRLRGIYGFTAQLGGKTGTNVDNRDAWYVGVAPRLVAGVWVGGEDQSVHPNSSGEGSAVALPVYGEFMKRVYADPSLGVRQTDVFDVPPGAVIYDCTDMETIAPETDPVEFNGFFE